MIFQKLVDFVCKPFFYYKSRRFEALDQSYIEEVYYRDSKFCSIDQDLISGCSLSFAYKKSREYERDSSSSLGIYGETPLEVYSMMARRWNISGKDVFYDLGCGRARGLFYLNHFFSCSAVGIELNESLVSSAKRVKKKWNLESLEIKTEDFFNSNLSNASFIYLFGTCLEENLLFRLAEKLKSLEKKPKIITVSAGLDELNSDFKVLDSFKCQFVWGKTMVYLNQTC